MKHVRTKRKTGRSSSQGFKYKARATPEEIEERARMRAAVQQEYERRLEQGRHAAREQAIQTLRSDLDQKASMMREAVLVELKVRKKLKLQRLTIEEMMIRQQCHEAYRLEQEKKPQTAADSYFVLCLKNMIISRQIKAGKVYDMLQDRLMRYLATGERDDHKKSRVRIVIDDTPDVTPPQSPSDRATGPRGPFEGA